MVKLVSLYVVLLKVTVSKNLPMLLSEDSLYPGGELKDSKNVDLELS